MPGAMIEFSPYRLDLRAGRLWRGSHPVALRPKAWALLRYLAERPGALVTKEELHTAIWAMPSCRTTP
jgi:DNA-binding winged helix-turn-helix (wHTH) protein